MMIRASSVLLVLVVVAALSAPSVAFVLGPACTSPSSTQAASSSSSFPLWMMNKNKKGKTKNKKKTKSSGGGGFGGGGTAAAAATATAARKQQQQQTKKDTFPYAGTVRPGIQSPQKLVLDESIVRPDYADTGIPSAGAGPKRLLPWMIEVKSPAEIQKMKDSGKLAREILDLAGRAVQAGVTTDHIDTVVHDAILAAGAYPSPLNYHGFPKSCCTSVNEVICHGIPDSRELQEGDIVNIDITVYLNGYHGDCSEMFYVSKDGTGEPADEATRKLLQTTYDCWITACQFVQPGHDYKEIGGIIEDYIVPRGFSTVRNFCGHGIGSVFHTNPNILHYRNSEPNGQMAAGHTFTIEPMICEASAKPLMWPDEWTATTVDGQRSAQFEHTLLVTPDGVEALTGKTCDSPVQFWERESKIHSGVWLGTTPAAIERMQEINAAKKPQL